MVSFLIKASPSIPSAEHVLYINTYKANLYPSAFSRDILLSLQAIYILSFSTVELPRVHGLFQDHNMSH